MLSPNADPTGACLAGRKVPPLRWGWRDEPGSRRLRGMILGLRPAPTLSSITPLGSGREYAYLAAARNSPTVKPAFAINARSVPRATSG
jgi:hypothetical protein